MTRKSMDPFFYILIRSRKSFDNFDRCIDSVLKQKYKNYKIIFIDDYSNLSAAKKRYIKKKLAGHIVKFNNQRQYSLKNAYSSLKNIPNDKKSIVFNLDGDDCLLNKYSLVTVAKVYKKNKNCLLTWGECLLLTENKLSDKPSKSILPFSNISYPKQTIVNGSYREESFLPLHPRTWKLWLFNKIRKKDFLRPDGSFLQFAEDQAIFFPLLEMAHGNYKVIQKPIYIHTFADKNSDAGVNKLGLIRDELVIRRKRKYDPL